MGDLIPTIPRGDLRGASTPGSPEFASGIPVPQELAEGRKLDPTKPEDLARAHELGRHIAATQVRVLKGVVDERILNPHREDSPDQPDTLTVGEALVFCKRGMTSMVGNLSAMAEAFGAKGDDVGEKVRQAVRSQAEKEREEHPELFAKAEHDPIGSKKKYGHVISSDS